ncbi:hypothetical protein M5E87_11295 [Flavonifractor plautii]|nr:hypothetical protein M5E87_11295 [Flavonifractor plautii]
MELTFRAAAPAERLYIAKQSTQIEGQTGSVGHLQADMGEDGKGFFPKWTSHRESLDTEDFQQEFEEVLEALVGDEQYGGFLKAVTPCGISAGDTRRAATIAALRSASGRTQHSMPI